MVSSLQWEPGETRQVGSKMVAPNTFLQAQELWWPSTSVTSEEAEATWAATLISVLVHE